MVAARPILYAGCCNLCDDFEPVKGIDSEATRWLLAILHSYMK